MFKALPAVKTTDLTSRRSLKDTLSNKDGISASLPEVLGAVGISIGILAAAAFGIGSAWNFGQDSTAQGTLESVKSAQLILQADTGKFGNKSGVETATSGGTKLLTTVPAEADLKVATSTDGRNYCASIKSMGMTSQVFYISSNDGKVSKTKPTVTGIAATAC